MSVYNINNATASNMEANTYSIASQDTDGVNEGSGETTWTNENFTKYWGYFTSHPELKNAILMKAMWDVGKGYTVNMPRDEAVLSLIKGAGWDSFQDIIFNMDVMRYVAGDSYAEIIRDEYGNLRNLKPLNPGSIRHVMDSKGLLIRYEQVTRTGEKESVIKFKPSEIFHLCNNRLADQCHGISVIESLEKNLLAELQSFDDTQKVMSRQAKPFIIFKLKTDDSAKIATIKTKIDNLRKLGEDLFIPDDDDVITHEVVQVNPSQMILAWRNDIQNRFYRALGMPLVIFGSANSTESGSKMEYLAHEQVFSAEQLYLENALWRALKIHINLNPPQSIAPDLATDTLKDGMAQQLNTQPSDVQAGVGR